MNRRCGLNERMAELLANAGSLNALAKRAGITPTTLYNLKLGKIEAGNITVDSFMRICEQLGVSPVDVYYGTERPKTAFDYYMELPTDERGFVDDVIAVARRRAALKEDADTRAGVGA